MATPNDDVVLPIPNLNLAQSTFILSSSKSNPQARSTASTALLAGIIADGELLLPFHPLPFDSLNPN
jgi:hypothetical protein